MRLINSDGQITDARIVTDGPVAQANNTGAPIGFMWANTLIATLGAAAGIIALVLVLTRLNVYADSIALEKRLNTQAIDELRVEANVSRKLAGLPEVNAQEHD